MVHKLVAYAVLAGEDRHLQRIERQAGPQMIGDLPADDLAGEQVRDERRIHKPAGRGHIRDVRDPPAVGRWRGEVPFQQVSRPPRTSIRHRGPRLLPPGRHPEQAHSAHQPLHRAPRHPDAVAAQLQPYFPRPIQAAAFPAVFPYTHDLLFQLLIPDLTRRRLPLTLLDRVIRGNREFKNRAGRPGTEPATM
jgi:hypothetical protein